MDPNNASVYGDRAIIKKSTNDRAGAITDYDVALRLKPNDANFYNNRGNLKFQAGNEEDAIRIIQVPSDAIQRIS